MIQPIVQGVQALTTSIFAGARWNLLALAAPPAAGQRTPLDLITESKGPVLAVVISLIFAAMMVWFIAAYKFLQLRRLSVAEDHFERDAAAAASADDLFDCARLHEQAPGSRIVRSLRKRRDQPEVLESVAKRAIVREQQVAGSLLPTLASIGAASPFVGLFGTVWGIMEAFMLIGFEKSASLPVVAPAIGEALIATAIGLLAAIPAVIFYNAINRRVDDLLDAVEASADGWVAQVHAAPARPRVQASEPPPPNIRRSVPPPIPAK
jgi:biopolymer transport protein TolQ